MPVQYAEIPSADESSLAPKLLEGLPDAAPPAPWRARARGVFWWARPDRRASKAITELLPDQLAGSSPLLTVGAMLAYDEVPVGPYSEVFALLVMRRGAHVFTHVPFIAVDSAESVVGGRVNWALPKTLAGFEGAPAHRTAMAGAGQGWSVSATPVAYGPPLPWLLPPLGDLVQVDAAGSSIRSRPSGHGTGRLARVSVVVEAAGTLNEWLPSGVRPGMISSNINGLLPPART